MAILRRSIGLTISGLIIGVLGAMCGWAIVSSLSEREEYTFGLTGDVTTMTLSGSGEQVGTGSNQTAVAQLSTDLTRASVPLIVTPTGDGYPLMVVFDPAKAISWMTPDSANGASRYYVFTGSYTDFQLRSFGKATLLPEGTSIAGRIDAPRLTSGLQAVRTLGEDPPVPGTLVLGTKSEHVVNQITRDLENMGLKAENSAPLPLITSVIQQPLVAVTVLLFAMAILCCALWWAVILDGYRAQTVIYRRHGASIAQMTRLRGIQGAIALLIGGMAGMAIAAGGIVLISQATLERGSWLALGSGWACGLVLAALTWVAVVWLSLRRRSTIDDAI